MAKLKNLSNCKPSEFLKQTNKIRHAAAKWFDITDIMNIRRQQPELPEDADDDEIEKLRAEQAQKNLSEMLDSIMDKHPDETLELLALASFVEPKDVDKHTVSDYLGSFNELLNDPNVMGFFLSLLGLAQKVGREG